MEINRLYNEDCVLGLAKLKNESVDLILTDPPYNISRDSNFHTMKNSNRVGVDFGEWDKGFDQFEWLKVALPKLKKGGSLVIFNSWEVIGSYYPYFRNYGCENKFKGCKCALCTAKYEVKEVITWVKPNPMPRNTDRLYVTTSEVAVWVTKETGWIFNKQRDTYENAIFHFPTVQGNRIHPTQKPVELMQELLRIHSNPGQLIVDPFSGSGTTAHACMLEGRNFIGFELSEEYFKKIQKRLFKNSVAASSLVDGSIKLFKKINTRLT